MIYAYVLIEAEPTRVQDLIKELPDAVLGINIRPIAQLNGAFIDTIVKPNIRWFGYVIFGAEAFIAATMFLGLFSRLGALVAIGMSAQLLIGLANIPNPFEWEWSYILMVLLSILKPWPCQHCGLRWSL